MMPALDAMTTPIIEYQIRHRTDHFDGPLDRHVARRWTSSAVPSLCEGLKLSWSTTRRIQLE